MNQTKTGDSQVAIAIVVGVAIIGIFLYFGLRDPEPPVRQPEGGYQSSAEIPPAYEGDYMPEAPSEMQEGGGMIVIPPEPVTLSDKEMIREALIAKTGIPEAGLVYSITESTGGIARGGVKRVGEMSGGYFFAAKDMEGVWVVTYDGSGVPMCDEVDPYGYPTSWIEYCVRDGETVKR